MTQDIRYRVTWIPLAEVEAEAKRLGMKDDDGSSLWDWTLQEYHEHHREFPAWQAAVAFAKRVARKDVFRSAHINKLTRMQRPAGRMEAWEVEGMWEVFPNDIGLDPNTPDVDYDPYVMAA